MAILAIVPGKPSMCLQENLADCVDCGGLPLLQIRISKNICKNTKPCEFTCVKNNGLLA